MICNEVRKCWCSYLTHLSQATYPNLIATFNDLKVELQPVEMSFSVSLENCIEWSSQGLSGVFAQRSNALSPTFWRMLADIKRFARDVEAYLARPDSDMSATLQSFLQELRYVRILQFRSVTLRCSCRLPPSRTTTSCQCVRPSGAPIQGPCSSSLLYSSSAS
jgi:hypothetical protein